MLFVVLLYSCLCCIVELVWLLMLYCLFVCVVVVTYTLIDAGEEGDRLVALLIGGGVSASCMLLCQQPQQTTTKVTVAKSAPVKRIGTRSNLIGSRQLSSSTQYLEKHSNKVSAMSVK